MIKQVISKNYFAFSTTNDLTIKNMGHITGQYGPYYRTIWAILPTHPQPLPEGGGLKEKREKVL